MTSAILVAVFSNVVQPSETAWLSNWFGSRLGLATLVVHWPLLTPAEAPLDTCVPAPCHCLSSLELCLPLPTPTQLMWGGDSDGAYGQSSSTNISPSGQTLAFATVKTFNTLSTVFAGEPDANLMCFSRQHEAISPIALPALSAVAFK